MELRLNAFVRAVEVIGVRDEVARDRRLAREARIQNDGTGVEVRHRDVEVAPRAVEVVGANEAIADLNTSAKRVLTDVWRLERAENTRGRARDVRRLPPQVGVVDAAVAEKPVHHGLRGLWCRDVRDIRAAIFEYIRRRAARGRSGAVDAFRETSNVDVVSRRHAELAVGGGVGLHPVVDAGRIGEGAVRVERQRPVRRVGHEDTCERCAVDVAVVAQHTGRVDAEQRVLGSGVAVVRGFLMQRVDRLILVVTRPEVEAQVRVEVPLVVDEGRLRPEVGTERRREDRKVDDVRVRAERLLTEDIDQRDTVRVAIDGVGRSISTKHEVRRRLIVVREAALRPALGAANDVVRTEGFRRPEVSRLGVPRIVVARLIAARTAKVRCVRVADDGTTGDV